MYIMTIAMQTVYLLTCSVSDKIYWRKINYYYYYYCENRLVAAA